LSTEVTKALFLDDEPYQLELVLLLLEESDPSIKTTFVQTTQEAMDLIKEGSFDVVVSDYQLQGTTGIKFYAEVRRVSNVPYILYTGRGSEEVAAAAYSAGIDGYVRKDNDLSHILILGREIRHVVESRKAERRLRDAYAEVAALNVKMQDTWESLRRANRVLAKSNRELKMLNEDLATRIRALEDAYRQLSYEKSEVDSYEKVLASLESKKKERDNVVTGA